jgi:pyridoxal biosynthesis lyase PdxS
MEELLNQITEAVDSIREDAAKFEAKGNGAAGTRVRKAMQTIKSLAQDVRVNVSESKKA